MDVDVLEIVDIEEYAKRGEKPPKALKYKIKIDGKKYTVNDAEPTGLALLQLVGKAPPEQYQLFKKLRGGHLEEISPNERVDLTQAGVEKFVTLPLDQTDGADA